MNETKSNKAGERTHERGNVYDMVTEQIISLLESGVVPWHKPWAGGGEIPRNFVSGKEYRGINVWMLGATGYASPYWVSFKQARDLGGNVRKGEKSSLAVFWKWLECEDKANPGSKKRVPLLRYYRVFNVTQCEGFEYPQPEIRLPEFNPIEEAEKIVAGMANPPTLTHSESQAYYSRSEDRVNMPGKGFFDGEPAYYSTLFHELTHATGHDSRLGRLQNSVSGFGSTSYAKEELVAEMGASFLCGVAGILNRTADNSAAYINSWLGRLKDDRTLVVHAAAAAQKSSDYILGKTFVTAGE